MQLLAVTRAQQQIWLHQLDRPFVLAPPFAGQRHVAIVFSNDETVTDDERKLVTDALFKSGCRYGVFAGHEGGLWHDAMDWSCLSSDPDYNPSDGAFTPTTWHDNESVEKVVFFGLNCAMDPFCKTFFQYVLILFVGPRPGLRKEVEAAMRSVLNDAYGS